ncbi:MAG: hypothetical protein EBZ86_10190 [Synechococcaceae bacterium WB9_2_069]|nr:hypothetical protein [Synechococcaceae bacterium WB9_2_069]
MEAVTVSPLDWVTFTLELAVHPFPSCPNGNNGAIDLTVAGGIAPYIFTWSNGASTEDLSSLTAGNYSVSVTDFNGCTANANVTITQPTLLTTSASSTNVTCNGLNNGTATVTAAGGTAPYTYLWNSGATTPSITNLAPGNYSVTVTDANGCSANANVTITQPILLTANASSTNLACNGINNGTATVTAAGGTASYNYLWNTGATTPSITNLAPGP